MKKRTDINIKEKPGSIHRVDKKTQRYSDLKAAVQAQVTNEGKVPVRVDRRTVILVPISQRDQYEKRYRLGLAKHPDNMEKVEFLKEKGWILREDGIWRNREKFLYREFEVALNISGYYDRNRVSWKP